MWRLAGLIEVARNAFTSNDQMETVRSFAPRGKRGRLAPLSQAERQGLGWRQR